MPAGTIALTNNSAAVTGTGTSFTSELKANDFVVVVVGGVTYTLGVKSVESATALTLITAYGGANTSGLSWTPVPNATLVGITAQVAADVAKAIRGLNLDKANWQQVFTGTGNVTVNLPDGTSFTGPAWNGIASAISGKLDKTQNLKDVENTATARQNLGLGNNDAGRSNLGLGNDATGRANMGLGNSATRDVGTVAGTVAAGNDQRITTLNGNLGGVLAGNVTFRKPVSSELNTTSYLCTFDVSTGSASRVSANLYSSISGSSTRLFNIDIYSDQQGGKPFRFFQDSGSATCVGQWINGSDERHKSNIKLVPNALAAVLGWRGATYDKKDGTPEVGLIAQDVERDCPEAILMEGQREFSDGTVIKDFKYLNTSGASAAYHTEAIKDLFNLIEIAIVDPDKALGILDNIKVSIKTGSAS
jgi:hypothetical protein